MYSIFDVKTFPRYINVRLASFFAPFCGALWPTGEDWIFLSGKGAHLAFPSTTSRERDAVYIGETCNFSHECNAKMCTQRQQPRSKRRKRGDLVTRETFHWNVGKKRKEKKKKGKKKIEKETKGMTSKEGRKSEREVDREGMDGEEKGEKGRGDN